jgi:hypothetical protein
VILGTEGDGVPQPAEEGRGSSLWQGPRAAPICAGCWICPRSVPRK